MRRKRIMEPRAPKVRAPKKRAAPKVTGGAGLRSAMKAIGEKRPRPMKMGGGSVSKALGAIGKKAASSRREVSVRPRVAPKAPAKKIKKMLEPIGRAAPPMGYGGFTGAPLKKQPTGKSVMLPHLGGDSGRTSKPARRRAPARPKAAPKAKVTPKPVGPGQFVNPWGKIIGKTPQSKTAPLPRKPSPGKSSPWNEGPWGVPGRPEVPFGKGAGIPSMRKAASKPVRKKKIARAPKPRRRRRG